MNIRRLTTIAAGLTLACVADAAIGITGTSLNNAIGLSADEVGVYIISDGTPFSTVSITEGADILDSSAYGAGFTVMGSNTAAFGFGSTTLGSGHTDVNASFTGDIFAVFVFENSTTTALIGDSYNVWTDPTWVLPSSDGQTVEFAASPGIGQVQQLSDAADFSGTVSAVPEPSAFAALAGVCALGFVAMRRRSR